MSTDDSKLEHERPRASRPLADAPEPTPPEPPRGARPIIVRARPRVLETVLLASAAALLAAVAWPIATQGFGDGPAPADPAPSATTDEPTPPPSAASQATIQIALLLDTSGSMDGLIDQARSQLWQVVNALDSATFQDRAPRLEIAVYEYGNDRLSLEAGFLRQVSPFSTELDLVSEALFALTTSGGDEYAGQVIATAVDDLQWRAGDDVLRVVYIAGNEEFTQGPVEFHQAIAKARAKGIVINTVNCLGYGAVPDVGWEDGAKAGGGKFLRIDHNSQHVYMPAPQDGEIAKLGQEINATYVKYGYRGDAGLGNVMRQDDNSVGAGAASNVQRALSKGGTFYKNPGWDLVDALEEGTLEIGSVDKATLSDELGSLSNGELAQYVEGKKKERDKLKQRLGALKQAREEFVTAERAKMAGDDATQLEDAIIESIALQAEAAGFSLNRS